MRERVVLKLDGEIVENVYPCKVLKNERLIYNYKEYIVMSVLYRPFPNEIVVELTIELL